MSDEIYIGVEATSDAKVLIISMAARLAGMHPQTLRTQGGGRRYSERDVALLREVQRLSQEEGVNLAGIKRIIGLEQLVGDLQQRVAELEHDLARARQRLADLEAAGFPRRDLVPSGQSQTALVVWRPRRPSQS